MIKDRKPKLWKKLPEWTVVIGKYKGDVTAKRVMIIGTCSEIFFFVWTSSWTLIYFFLFPGVEKF
jgi:hypothetical protein